MEKVTTIHTRRTSVDIVFDHLYDEINTLRLLPGSKISEAEIAAKFDVSRQPVRDAFSRLENLDLILIRPQKATVVRPFSTRAIVKSRFVRAAIEAEVIRKGAAACDTKGAQRLTACLEQQRKIVENENFDAFNELDYEFHRTLCEIAGLDFAFEVVSGEKAKLDRLCVLSLSGGDRLSLLVDDHAAIAENIKQGNAEAAVEAGMLHLSRLDATIAKISSDHPDYFDL